MTARLAARVAVGAGLVGVLISGCGSSGASGGVGGHAPPPVLSVVTALYPLAQVAQQMGGSAVAVDDVVPAGANPLTYRLSPAQADAVRSAGLVLEAGGLQPWFGAAAAHARDVLDVEDRLSGSGYPWVDPQAMSHVAGLVAAAMARANPPAAGVYRNDAQGFTALLESTSIDYESTLSTCTRQEIFTADHAFSAMAKDYGLAAVALGTGAVPGASAVGALASRVQASESTTVFSETWVDDSTVEAVAAAAGVKVRQLDTLLGPPAGGWPAGSTYIGLLEANLGTLDSALGCVNEATGS